MRIIEVWFAVTPSRARVLLRSQPRGIAVLSPGLSNGSPLGILAGRMARQRATR